MGIVTTHTEGRVVTHSDDDRESIPVVQLPNRDAGAIAAASHAVPKPAPSAAVTAAHVDPVRHARRKAAYAPPGPPAKKATAKK